MKEFLRHFISHQIDELEKGVQLWTKLLKNVRGDFKDLEKKKKKNSADEYRKKITKVGKDVVKIVKNMKTFVTKVKSDGLPSYSSWLITLS